MTYYLKTINGHVLSQHSTVRTTKQLKKPGVDASRQSPRPILVVVRSRLCFRKRRKNRVQEVYDTAH
jgi:hypothetical protein